MASHNKLHVDDKVISNQNNVFGFIIYMFSHDLIDRKLKGAAYLAKMLLTINKRAMNSKFEIALVSLVL